MLVIDLRLDLTVKQDNDIISRFDLANTLYTGVCLNSWYAREKTGIDNSSNHFYRLPCQNVESKHSGTPKMNFIKYWHSDLMLKKSKTFLQWTQLK